MLKSIKTIDLSNEFYTSYLSLLNEFRETKFSKDYLIEFINNLPNNHDILLLFDNKNSNIIGTITIILEKKLINNVKLVCHIEDLIISTLYKNKGYGSKILDIIKEFAREKNCYKIILNCSDDLKKFYKKNSFENKNIQMSIYF
jgi:glucosamine-phosphate N-acetyltransferase